MNAQTARIEARSISLPRRAGWLDEFRRELLAFPAGRYSDQVDALSQAMNHAFNPRRQSEACAPRSCKQRSVGRVSESKDEHVWNQKPNRRRAKVWQGPDEYRPERLVLPGLIGYKYPLATRSPSGENPIARSSNLFQPLDSKSGTAAWISSAPVPAFQIRTLFP
jgi:hypothetical protein